MSLLAELQNTAHFNASEETVAQYILTNREQVLEMSIQTLSEHTYTSPSTIVRLCRKMGLKGFKDFKINRAGESEQKLRRPSPNTCSKKHEDHCGGNWLQ